MSEHIVYIPDEMHDSDELFVGNIRKEKALIRCKDCKYWGGAGRYCDYDMRGLDDDYCSRAERKENETD